MQQEREDPRAGYPSDGSGSSFDEPGYPPYDEFESYGNYEDYDEYDDRYGYDGYGEPEAYEDDGGSGHWRPSRALDGRYEPRVRRTTAEPLSASWRPAEQRERAKKGRQRSALRRLLALFGWRLYAVPVLLAVTVFVIVQMVNEPRTGADAETAGEGHAHEAPAVRENPAEPLDLDDIPTARLPAGGSYTKKGDGTFHIVPGTSEQVGRGELYTYTIEVENGLDPASFQGDKLFADSVQAILEDPRSWTGTGEIALRRVDASGPEPDFRVTLTSSATTHRPGFCGNSISFESSCYRENVDGESRVVINLARWVRGALAFNSDMLGYRQYLVNHEVGHALDLGHVGCPKDGALAPVMMQQTFGVANDYVAKLNDVPGGDQDSVPADGKTCKPNAWPNPQPNGR